MDNRELYSRPRLKIYDIGGLEKAELIQELVEAETAFLFYQSKAGDNRCLFTSLCFDQFIFLVSMINRSITMFEFMKTVVTTIEKMRENESQDYQGHIIEAAEYLNILPGPKPTEKEKY